MPAMTTHVLQQARLAAGIACAFSLCSLGSSALAQQPRTSWGEPDIAGSYSEFTLAPLERPEELGTREFFTPEEARAWQERILNSSFSADDIRP